MCRVLKSGRGRFGIHSASDCTEMFRIKFMCKFAAIGNGSLTRGSSLLLKRSLFFKGSISLKFLPLSRQFLSSSVLFSFNAGRNGNLRLLPNHGCDGDAPGSAFGEKVDSAFILSFDKTRPRLT